MDGDEKGGWFEEGRVSHTRMRNVRSGTARCKATPRITAMMCGKLARIGAHWWPGDQICRSSAATCGKRQAEATSPLKEKSGAPPQPCGAGDTSYTRVMRHRSPTVHTVSKSPPALWCPGILGGEDKLVRTRERDGALAITLGVGLMGDGAGFRTPSSLPETSPAWHLQPWGVGLSGVRVQTGSPSMNTGDDHDPGGPGSLLSLSLPL